MRGLDTPIFIVYGANEPFAIIDQAKAAREFFKDRHYRHVSIEEIPNSGVDYRAEIVTNYFLGAFNEKAGPDRAAFYRAATRAGLCLLGEPDPDAAPRSDPKAEPQQIYPAKTLAALEACIDAHPSERDGVPYGRFLCARLLHEKLHDEAKAEARLREFSKQPLVSDVVAPEALLYLVDQVLGPTADKEDALALLHQAVDRFTIRPETATRAKELIRQLAPETK